MNIRNMLHDIESKYKKKKLNNKLKRAEKLLEIDWNEINNKRESLGLPEITNETTRKAYLDDYFKEDMIDELNFELEYNMLLREWEDELKNKGEII